ncbi:MAG TPA: hypothetical protein VFF48_02400, partial [Brevundimonas sp.]|nr:hypothetical protein [Brevundimonas sp.]
LDSALRYRYGVQLLQAANFDPTRFSGGALSVTPGQGNPIPQDDSLAAAMGGPQRRTLVAEGFRHADFSDLRGSLPALLASDQDRDAFRSAYARFLEQLVAFLNQAMDRRTEN